VTLGDPFRNRIDAEAPIFQHELDIGVPGDHPRVEETAVHGILGLERAVDRIGIAADPLLERIEADGHG
jgi:hypothetical protein